MRPSGQPPEPEPYEQERILLQFPELQSWLERQPRARLARLTADPMTAVLKLWSESVTGGAPERLREALRETPAAYHEWLLVIVLKLEEFETGGYYRDCFLGTVASQGFLSAVINSVDSARDPTPKDERRGENFSALHLDEHVWSRSPLTGQAFREFVTRREIPGESADESFARQTREIGVKWLPHFDSDCVSVLVPLLLDDNLTVRQWAAWHLCTLAPDTPGLEAVVRAAVRRSGIAPTSCDGLVRLAGRRPAPHFERTLADCISTVPRAQAAARVGVLRWYQANHQPAPEHMIWHHSPRAAMEAAARQLPGWVLPEELRVRDLRLGMRHALTRSPGWPQQLFARCQSRLKAMRLALEEALTALAPEDSPIAQCGHGQFDLDWIPALEACGDTTGLAELSRSCGWWIAQEDTCHLSLRPVRFDADSVEYPDGWTVGR